MTPFTLDEDGWIRQARRMVSPNSNEWPEGQAVELIVIHAISLPPDVFNGPGVEQLFTNTLDAAAHPYYAGIAGLKVSAHFFIRRDGELVQFVPTRKRAWHAGVSRWRGREGCNDFSLGIELEGSDHHPFEQTQYDCLVALLDCLCDHFPLVDVCGHCDIAPGRKTDPGPHFDWETLRVSLAVTGRAGLGVSGDSTLGAVGG